MKTLCNGGRKQRKSKTKPVVVHPSPYIRSP